VHDQGCPVLVAFDLGLPWARAGLVDTVAVRVDSVLYYRRPGGTPIRVVSPRPAARSNLESRNEHRIRAVAMTTHRIASVLTALAAAAALSACGGGGGGGAGGSDTAAGATGGGTAGSGTGAGAGGSGSGSPGSGGSGSGSGGGSGSGTGGSSSGSGGSGSGSTGTAGGSAGGGAGASDGPAAAADVPSAGTLQLVADTANYPGGSTEGATWRDLNTARQLAGAGWLSQSTALDTAAAAHSTYLTSNIDVMGHAEDPGKTAYYAATPADRASKAGFAASFTAETISSYRPQVNLQSLDCAGDLLNSVYNAAALLGPATHVGLHGFAATHSGAQFCLGLVAAPSNRPEGQVVPAGNMVAYPYDGQSGVIESVNLQVEAPRPSAAALPNNLAGTPVIVNVRNADYLNGNRLGSLNPKVTQFSMTDGSGNAVPSAILAHAALTGAGVALTQDANLPVGTVVLVPLSPLYRSQPYTVTFSATLKDGGPTLHKSWSFKTRP